jgi:hypothetical protein
MKILIRTGKCEATTERVARFLPTIGTVTLDEFTTGHPRARPGCVRMRLILHLFTWRLEWRGEEEKNEGFKGQRRRT